MRATQTAPDWAVMIEQMVAAGLSLDAIGRAAESVMTERMVRHFRVGTQPPQRMAQALTDLWCKTLKKSAAKVPMTGGEK